MELALHIEINCISIIILLLIYGNIRKKRNQKVQHQSVAGQTSNHRSFDGKLFQVIMFLTALILFADTGMWLLDHKQGLMRAGLLICTTIYYLLQPLICMIWALYIHYGIHKDKKRIGEIWWIVGIPTWINTLLALGSALVPIYFSIDGQGVYHRGDFFVIATILSFVYPLSTWIYVIMNKKRINKNFYRLFLMYFVLPFIGAIFQILFYGIALIWVAMSLSILMVFINYQNEQMNMDYLTGLFNRRQLDYYLQEQIHKETKGLAGILLDLNEFKSINDQYGHVAGDEALRQASVILKNIFGPKAFLARYGGDEFVVLMELPSKEALIHLMDALIQETDRMNLLWKHSYQLSFSMGADFYLKELGLDSHQFLNHLDALMYQDKKNRRGLL